jgi:putative PEP-CTERM system histidine kinase
VNDGNDTPTMLLFWSHGLAAALFFSAAAWQADRWRDRAARTVILACAATAVWALATALAGVAAPVAQLAESIRNFAWLSFVYALLQRGGTTYRALSTLYSVLAFAVTATAISNALELVDPVLSQTIPTLLFSTFMLRIAFAVGALVAVHNLYTATTAGARAGVGLPLSALGILWGIDLTFYALCWVEGDWATDFATLRGFVAIALAPLIAIAVRRNADWTIRLSRTVAFRSIGLVAALAYLGIVVLSAQGLEAMGGGYVQGVTALAVVTAIVLAGAVMMSPRARAWCNVMLAKHLFAHRYDYRAEWLRFTDTLGVPGAAAAPLETRVVKAVADIVQAPGGLLLVPTTDGMAGQARWQWPTLTVPLDAGTAALVDVLAGGRIVELGPLQAGRGNYAEIVAIPQWILLESSAWAIVPLVHFDRLVGAVLLERPLIPRALDWEDFDLLRLAGRQVASYLAEARAQEALGDAARFDEFNRRFAFIMHDIKNLVSQLTLVTRNAERHADKPEFRADMIATLQSSTARMNDLLARLSQRNTGRSEEPRLLALETSAASVAAAHRARHPIIVAGDFAAVAIADPARLEQALSHLVQNAIDASPPNEPVTLTMMTSGNEAGIEVADRGTGMTADFVRTLLFKPFASTKSGGFGIGAYEARVLVVAMGGRMAIATSPGEGTRMTIWLPAGARAAARPTQRRAA